MMRCLRCGRSLKNPSPSGYGPTCARAVLGAKPKRVRLFDRRRATSDANQPDLFAEGRL